MSAPFGTAPLQIITADQRLAGDPRHQRRAHRHLRHRQDQPALDARRRTHAVPEPRGRRARGAGLARRRGPHPRLGTRPRSRLLDRRPEPGDARRPAVRPARLRAGLGRLRRCLASRQVRDDLRRLDLGRLPHLPAVVQGPAAGDVGPQRQAGPARHLRAARPGDDRLADPSPAHAAQEHLAGRPARQAARRLRQAVLRDADRGLEDRPRAARHRRRGHHARGDPPQGGRPVPRLRLHHDQRLRLPGQGPQRPPRHAGAGAPRPAHGQIRGPRPDQPGARLDFDLPAEAGATPTPTTGA